MRTLKDVYIKVTKQNKEELRKLLNSRSIMLDENIGFDADDYKCFTWVPLGTNKVSLAELKRLINTIPTREEITRLKRQISAYKTNYDRAVKHSLSKEDVIEELQNNNSGLIEKLFKANRDLKSKCIENYRLKDDIKKVRCERDSLNASFKSINEMYDNALKENERCKELQSDNETLSELYFDLLNENAKLKQHKWWQIWK